MNVILDLLMAIILGGVLLTSMLSANDSAVENHYVLHGDMLVQEMLVSTVPLIEGELRNIGFGIPADKNTVLRADSSSITFLTAQLNGPTTDTVSYYVGSPSELASTQNDQDRYLHRRVNGTEAGKAGVVTLFKLTYRDQTGEVIPTPVESGSLSQIYTIEITIEVQNPYALYQRPSQMKTAVRNALYSTTMWQQTRLASQNFRR